MSTGPRAGRSGAERRGPALAPSRRRAEVGGQRLGGRGRRPGAAVFPDSSGAPGTAEQGETRQVRSRRPPSRPRRGPAGAPWGPAGCEAAAWEGPGCGIRPLPAAGRRRGVAGVGALAGGGASPFAAAKGERPKRRTGALGRPGRGSGRRVFLLPLRRRPSRLFTPPPRHAVRSPGSLGTTSLAPSLTAVCVCVRLVKSWRD